MSDSSLLWAPTVDADDECFFRGTIGTPLPTDALDTLHSGLEGHGWMGDDGFDLDIARDVDKKRAFSGRVVKTVQNSYDETLKVVFYESSPNVLATVFGDANVDVDFTDGHRKTTIRHEDEQLPRSSFVLRVIETTPSGHRTRMLVIPEGQVTEIDTVSIKHNEIWMYSVTLDAYKPATGTLPDNPAAVNEYIDEPDVTVPGS